VINHLAWTLLLSMFKKQITVIFVIFNLLWAAPLFAQSKVFNADEFNMTAKLAHQLIKHQQPDLLGDGSQLVSLYYFGQNDTTSVVGLERVADDYLPIRWLLVFKGEQLLGWYYPVVEFPAFFKEGHLIFPVGSKAEEVYLFPEPPAVIVIENIQILFVTALT
jgi:hypothetical protein